MSPGKEEGGRKEVVSSLLLGASEGPEDADIQVSLSCGTQLNGQGANGHRTWAQFSTFQWTVRYTRGKTGSSCKLFGFASQAGYTCYHHVANVLNKSHLLLHLGNDLRISGVESRLQGCLKSPTPWSRQGERHCV